MVLSTVFYPGMYAFYQCAPVKVEGFDGAWERVRIVDFYGRGKTVQQSELQSVQEVLPYGDFVVVKELPEIPMADVFWEDWRKKLIGMVGEGGMVRNHSGGMVLVDFGVRYEYIPFFGVKKINNGALFAARKFDPKTFDVLFSYYGG